MVELGVAWGLAAAWCMRRLYRRAVDAHAAVDRQRAAAALGRLCPPAPAGPAAHVRVVEDRPLAPVVPLFGEEPVRRRGVIRGRLRRSAQAQ